VNGRISFRLDSRFVLNSFSESTYEFLILEHFGYVAFFNTYSWTASSSPEVSLVYENSFLLCDSFWLERLATCSEKSFRKIRGVEFFTKALMDTKIQNHLIIGPDSIVEEAFRSNCSRIGIPTSKVYFLSLPNPVEVEIAVETAIQFIDSIFENDVLIWISLGTPKQDLVGHKICQSLNSRVFGIGAAVDFIAYPSQEAPELLRRIGLEWLYRLMTSRRRLWRRYLQVLSFLFFRFLKKSTLTRKF
jgi:hypothetical protein